MADTVSPRPPFFWSRSRSAMKPGADHAPEAGHARPKPHAHNIGGRSSEWKRRSPVLSPSWQSTKPLNPTLNAIVQFRANRLPLLQADLGIFIEPNVHYTRLIRITGEHIGLAKEE